MRFGITILPEYRWSEAAPKWRAAEELGFDHAWTYDHLVWAGLPDSPWFGTTPTLTAAALTTATIGLGTFVTSPNYRHPVTFSRDILALDDVSQGRFICGMGTGGDLDSQLLGESLTLKQRTDRFGEFVQLLDRLLTSDHVSFDGEFFVANDARSLPGCVQQPRVPFIIAANGPKSLRLAAEYGRGWVTYGKPADTDVEWWQGLSELSDRLDDALDAAGRRDDPSFERHLNLDSRPEFSLSSLDRFEDLAGRAREAGFTDLIVHWPRPESPYAGQLSVLEKVATESIPRFRDM